MRLLRKIKFSLKRQKRRIIRWINRFEHFIADVLYDREEGLCGRLVGFLLYPFSLIFSLIVRLRSELYKRRILSSQQLGCHVIVVGNITMGGTGKTPIAEYLAKLLTKMGRYPAIISRGYKSRSEPYFHKLWRWIIHAPCPPPKVVSDGHSVLLSSEIAGDEPYMLAKNLPGIPVVVDKDRVKAGRYAIKNFGADVLVLDDGYQYFRLRSSFRFVLIDKGNPFGNHRLIPRGILREPISHLNRASCIVLTKSDGNFNSHLVQILKKYTQEDGVIECRHEPCFLMKHKDGEILRLEEIRGKKVAIFSGIASPESFECFIEKLGAEIVYRKRFIDHHRFSEGELISINEHSRGADYIVATEKDAVRIPSSFDFVPDLYFLRVAVKFLKNEEKIQKKLEDLFSA